MKNKRKSLSLEQLQVKSFVTNLEQDHAHTAKGGEVVIIGSTICHETGQNNACYSTPACPPPPTHNCPQHTDHCPNTETIIGCPV